MQIHACPTVSFGVLVIEGDTTRLHRVEIGAVPIDSIFLNRIYSNNENVIATVFISFHFGATT